MATKGKKDLSSMSTDELRQAIDSLTAKLRSDAVEMDRGIAELYKRGLWPEDTKFIPHVFEAQFGKLTPPQEAAQDEALSKRLKRSARRRELGERLL